MIKYPYFRLTAWCNLYFAQLWYNHMKSFDDCKGVFITKKKTNERKPKYEYAVWVIGIEAAEYPNSELIAGEVIECSSPEVEQRVKEWSEIKVEELVRTQNIMAECEKGEFNA